MATIVLSAVGTIVAGPLGGTLGALAGSQIDAAILGSGGTHDGPRIKELAVTTSSYGQPIARHFGTMRVPGTIIWSTGLMENRETSGGGKGKPKTTSFSYSISFAVALSSRPISAIGRIWADGNLLRGGAGDLKTSGTLRIYRGHGDQMPDPLVSAAENGNSPAFRGCAYVVFEDLKLEDFGNRIPALTFEVFADSQSNVSLSAIAPDAHIPLTGSTLEHMIGFSDEGGPVLSTLKSIDRIYPLNCVAEGAQVELGLARLAGNEPPVLPHSLATPGRDGTKGANSEVLSRAASEDPSPIALRYYDQSRDYQPGVQRAIGQRGTGQELVLELPATLDADGARRLTNAKANKRRWRAESISWRLAELDPKFGPGSIVKMPGHSGVWQITSWEWSDLGIELSLERIPPAFADATSAEPGRSNDLPDHVAVPTVIRAFELPWDGSGSPTDGSYFAAASASSIAWAGAALFAEQSGNLAPLNVSASQRSVIGETVRQLEPSNCTEFEEAAVTEVELVADDLALGTTTVPGLANGANRMLIGNEVIQFLSAEQLGPLRWQLSGLLRGRGGTEDAASRTHPAGTTAVLLDDTLISLDPTSVAEIGATTVAAIGLGDDQPALATLMANGVSRRPPHPVHPNFSIIENGDWVLSWERRARGQWRWPDFIATPLVEEVETYQVGIGDPDQPMQSWATSLPNFTLTSASVSLNSLAAPQAPVWVRQIGTYGPSPATLITHLP